MTAGRVDCNHESVLQMQHVHDTVFYTCFCLFVCLFIFTSMSARSCSISEHGPPPLVGPLAVNKALKRGVKLFENELAGPEDFAVDENGET